MKRDLASTMKRRLGKDYKRVIDHETWQRPVLTKEQLEYAAADVQWLHPIKEEQVKQAGRRGLDTALVNEQRLTLLVVRMCKNGMPLRRDILDQKRTLLIEQAQEAMAYIGAKLGPKFNPNSPKQVVKAVREITGIDIPDAKAETIAPMGLELTDNIMIVKRAKKRADFYDPDWYAKHVTDGVVRASYWQTGTDTVRFSSSQPNLQQIPKNMRDVFGHQEGLAVVSADYAQIELRVMADVANDKELKDALESEDFHSYMATIMFDTDEPTPKQRH